MNASSFDPTASIFGMMLVIFGIVLAVCALLMPLFVVAIHSRLKLMHKEMEKQTWYLHKIANREQ
jgi:ABC-type spermidine/putrescine transport system permease subunit II